MTPRELDTDPLLAALGELQRRERAELARLDERAWELATREPQRAQALEDRLMDELFQPVVHPKEAKPITAHSRRSRGIASAAAVCIALVAAVMISVQTPATRRFEVSYTLIAPAPDAQTRTAAAPATTGVYSLGRTLVFTLRPAERYEGALSVTCYALQDAQVIPLNAQVELDSAGGARVVMARDMLSRSLHEGSWQLQFYIAPPSAAVVDRAQVRARQCPSDTRCLSFAARFVQP